MKVEVQLIYMPTYINEPVLFLAKWKSSYVRFLSELPRTTLHIELKKAEPHGIKNYTSSELVQWIKNWENYFYFMIKYEFGINNLITCLFPYYWLIDTLLIGNIKHSFNPKIVHYWPLNNDIYCCMIQKTQLTQVPSEKIRKY